LGGISNLVEWAYISIAQKLVGVLPGELGKLGEPECATQAVGSELVIRLQDGYASGRMGIDADGRGNDDVYLYGCGAQLG